MKLNVCINGTFRYPHYIRHYEEAGALGGFFFAHRRSTTRDRLGLRAAPVRNNWLAAYAHQAAFRWAPADLARTIERAAGDAWQDDVIRNWRDCDGVEAVIGAVADRVLAHARARGCRTVGHPVTSHPASVARLVGAAHAGLGLPPESAFLPEPDRRDAEIAACDRLIVDSRFVARSFAAEGVPADRIVVVTPGVDPARFAPRRPDERDRACFRVVSVGTLTPRKGQHLLLQAWRRLALTRAELTLIGPRGRHADAVVRGHEGRFVHHPRIAHADLRAALVRASVFVAPSVEDGFGQAPLEAMACGVPVVVTETIGMADLVVDGVNGFLVPPFDADAIADRLATLHRDPERADRMGAAAADTVRRLGSWADYVDRVLAVHRSLR